MFLLNPAKREFFWLMVRRDLNVRYAGSSLGALWNLIHPLVMIAIYMTIFSALMRHRPGGELMMREGGVNLVDYGSLTYGVHLVSGLIAWMLFADVLLRSLTVLVDNSNFLQKVSFPPTVLFASVLFNGLMIYAAGYAAFLALLVLTGHAPPAAAVGAVGVMVLMGLMASGLGLLLSGLHVFMRDIAQGISILVQIVFWMTPIVYIKEVIRPFNPAVAFEELMPLEQAGRVLMWLNPMERFVSLIHYLFGLAVTPPTISDWLIVFGLPIVSCWVGLWVFRRLMPEVRDCL